MAPQKRERVFETVAFQRVDPTIDFMWIPEEPSAASGLALVPSDCSVCWDGHLLAPESSGQPVIFRVFSIDGVIRLWVYLCDAAKPAPIISNWTVRAMQAHDSSPQDLTPGGLYKVRLEYFSGHAPGGIRLCYYFAGDDPQEAKTILPELLYAQA